MTDYDTPAQPFDLSALDTGASSDSGRDLELTHFETGEPLGITLTLAGSDSRVYRKAYADINNRRMGGRVQKLTIEELNRGAIELLARCTLAWTNVRWDGEDRPCTRENAQTLYTRFPFVREQAERFIENRANYLRD